MGGPASLQGPACSPHTQLITNVGTESYQNCFREICCLKGIWRNPAFIGGTLVIKSSLSISFLKSGLPFTWLYIKEEPNSIFSSYHTAPLSSHGPGSGKSGVTLGHRHKSWGGAGPLCFIHSPPHCLGHYQGQDPSS